MFPTRRCSRLAWPIRRGLIQPVLVALAGLMLAGGAGAQGEPPTVTIGDLTAAQRALIDAEIRRTLGKAQGRSEPLVPALPTAGASALAIPLVAAAATSAATAQSGALATVAPPPQGADAAADPRLSVTGQAQLRGTWRAEVVTDTGVYLLSSGQAVPGTQWRVAAVEPGRVTLSDAASGAARSKKEKGARRARSHQRHFVLGDAQ